jgi:raffinose/stachyose/melibiose transport system permease protein
MKAKKWMAVVDIVAVVVSSAIFIVPFLIVILNAGKTQQEAAALQLSLPKTWHFIKNLEAVFSYQNRAVLRAFLNSMILTFLSVIGIVIVSSMTGFILQRRRNRFTGSLNYLVLGGLIVPPAIVPTIWLLKLLNLFKTIPGLALVEVALNFSFSTIMYTSFLSTVPREIDEAGIIDGCGPYRLFFQIIFPLMKPITATVIILAAVNVYNDFMNPLYFLPGAKNLTVQLTLYFFQGQFESSWNLLFADILIISLPSLIFYMIFRQRIISGTTAGAIKG